jgi:hypothetical protein
MPFSIRPFRRFPVHCAITYNAGPFQGQGRSVRFHRVLLQSQATALDVRLSQSDGVRNAGGISVTSCQPNRQQPNSQ